MSSRQRVGTRVRSKVLEVKGLVAMLEIRARNKELGVKGSVARACDKGSQQRARGNGLSGSA